MNLSDCCKAPVKVEGDVTMFYRCTKCSWPCGVKHPEKQGFIQRFLNRTIFK